MVAPVCSFAETAGDCRQRLRWVDFKQDMLDGDLARMIRGRPATIDGVRKCHGSQVIGDVWRQLSEDEIRWNRAMIIDEWLNPPDDGPRNPEAATVPTAHIHGGTRLLDEEERNSSRSRSRRSGRARQRQIRFRQERQRSPGREDWELGLRASFSPSVKEALRRVRPYAGQGGRGRRQGARSKE